MNNDTLEHFGVKGMRWGRRKYGTKSSVGSKLKKAAIYGGAAALTGLAAYGAYKGLKGRSNYSSAVTKIISQRKSKIKPDMDYAESILKNAWTKQRPKSSAPNYGDKLKDISKNLSKSQQKVKKQSDAINKANDDALNLLKNLMK